jgi:hypothetical protein
MIHSVCIANVCSFSGCLKILAGKAGTHIDPARLRCQPACLVSLPVLSSCLPVWLPALSSCLPCSALFEPFLVEQMSSRTSVR